MPFSLPSATRNRLLAVAIVAACAFSVAFPRPWQDSLRASALAVAQPPQAILAATHDALRRAIDRIGALWNAAEEIQRLRDENRALREALARQADEASQTEARIRNIAEFQDFRSASLVRPLRVLSANVIGADPSPWRHTLLIDRGTNHGLRLGTPAVWGTSIVGTIVALRPAAAAVRLLTDGRAGLTVRVARTGDVGLLRGTSERDSQLQLKWIHLHPVEAGDMIVTSDLDPIVPRGLVAGRVVSASASRRPLFYDVKVRPLLDFDRLTEVLLVVYTSSEPEELIQEETNAPAPNP